MRFLNPIAFCLIGEIIAGGLMAYGCNAAEVTASSYVIPAGYRLPDHTSYRPGQPVVASTSLPLGTKVSLTNRENGKRVVAFVKDRGPYVKGRDVDLCRSVARKLGILRKGIARLDLEIEAYPKS